MPRSPVTLRSVRLGRLLVIAGAGLVLGDRVLAQAAPESAVIHQLGGQFSAAYLRGDAAAMAALTLRMR